MQNSLSELSVFTWISTHCHFLSVYFFLLLLLEDELHLPLEYELLLLLEDELDLLLEDELLDELLLLSLHLGQGSVLGGQPGSGNDFQKQQVFYQ